MKNEVDSIIIYVFLPYFNEEEIRRTVRILQNKTKRKIIDAEIIPEDSSGFTMNERRIKFKLAPRVGFEPKTSTDSKSAILPLDDRGMGCTVGIEPT